MDPGGASNYSVLLYIKFASIGDIEKLTLLRSGIEPLFFLAD